MEEAGAEAAISVTGAVTRLTGRTGVGGGCMISMTKSRASSEVFKTESDTFVLACFKRR